MLVKDFVKDYKDKPERLHEDYISETLKIKDYIPYTVKLNTAERIAKTTVFVYEDGKPTNRIRVNSKQRAMLARLCLVDLWTELDVKFENIIEEYDELEHLHLIDRIISLIPENEAGEFYLLIDSCVNDYLYNNCEIHNYMSDKIENIGKIFEIVAFPLVEKVIDVLDNLDEKKVEKFMNKVNKVIDMKALGIVKQS